MELPHNAGFQVRLRQVRLPHNAGFHVMLGLFKLTSFDKYCNPVLWGSFDKHSNPVLWGSINVKFQ